MRADTPSPPPRAGTEPQDDAPNAKDPRSAPPVDLPHVTPQHYPSDIGSGGGSAAPRRPRIRP